MLSPGTPPPPLSSCDGRLPLIVVVVWWARPDASPPGSDTTPFLAIANARASGLIALAAAGQAPGARPVGILLHLGNCEMKYPRNRGRRQRRGRSLRLPNIAFRAAQTRKRGKEEKRKRRCHIRPLHLFAGPASPLASHGLDTGPAITPSACCGFGGPLRWQGCPHCQDPSSCSTPTPGPSSRVVAVLSHCTMEVRAVPRLFPGSLCCFSVSSTPLVAPASRVFTWTLPCCLPRQKLLCLLSPRSRSSRSDRQAGRGPDTPSINTDRPVDLDQGRCLASEPVPAPPRYQPHWSSTRPPLGGFHPSREPYIPAGTARADFMSAASCPPFKPYHARCRPRRSFIGPSPHSLAWSPLTTVISGSSKEP